jgi:site-specific DNA recombinase
MGWSSAVLAGVGTNCHKMRGRNGTWHRYYYCRNHDPVRAGGTEHRCPERNIRSEALDAFVFDQIREVLLRPDLLLTAARSVATLTPATNDELLDAELARLTRRRDAADAEHRRLVDLYQAGLIDLTELQRRNTEVEHRRRDLTQRRDDLTRQRQELARNNQMRRRVHDFAARIRTGIDSLDFEQKQTLLRLLVEEVRVTGWHVEIQLRIALDEPPAGSRPSKDQPPQDGATPTVSSEDSLRSLGDPQGHQPPASEHRNRHPALRTSREHGTLRTAHFSSVESAQVSSVTDTAAVMAAAVMAAAVGRHVG